MLKCASHDHGCKRATENWRNGVTNVERICFEDEYTDHCYYSWQNPQNIVNKEKGWPCPPALHPILVIIHSTSCRMLFSKAKELPPVNKGLDLFFITAPRELAPIGEIGLPLDVKQLSTEQSPILAGTFTAFLFSRAAAISDRQGIFMVSSGFIPSQSLETLICSSESSSLAASSPAVAAAWSLRALQAFSSIDCRYLPCASILSWRWRWTCLNKATMI